MMTRVAQMGSGLLHAVARGRDDGVTCAAPSPWQRPCHLRRGHPGSHGTRVKSVALTWEEPAVLPTEVVSLAAWRRERHPAALEIPRRQGAR
jgi:hypothetical protein